MSQFIDVSSTGTVYLACPAPQGRVIAGLETQADYQAFFNDQVTALPREGRYRVFAELERIAGEFPHAAPSLGGRGLSQGDDLVL